MILPRYHKKKITDKINNLSSRQYFERQFFSLFSYQVGERTSVQATQCKCNHATFFGSLNVKPNPIGPPSFTKFKEGFAMLVFVGVIFSLYLVGLIWARRKDRAVCRRHLLSLFGGPHLGETKRQS